MEKYYIRIQVSNIRAVIENDNNLKKKKKPDIDFLHLQYEFKSINVQMK